jgi:hypothetical protein
LKPIPQFIANGQERGIVDEVAKRVRVGFEVVKLVEPFGPPVNSYPRR